MSVKRIHNKKFRKGFLLPDVMIAVFVTVTALVTIMAAIAPVFRAEFYKRDEIIATGLAQEGIELMRNVRDNNWKTCDDDTTAPCVSPSIPKSAFAAPFPSDGTHCADYDSGVDSAIGCESGDALYNSAGSYSHTGAGVSRFKRTIAVSPASGSTTEGVRKIITSTVTWGADSSVTLTDTLTDWGDK